MIQVRKSADRGHFNFEWLDTRYTFSFDQYHDPRFMGFGSLRVINEDHIAPGAGFPTHSHRDMEIISYVLSGEIEHKDSMGNTARIVPGQVQRMSAGTGVTHSEQNPSKVNPIHLLQIWIFPSQKNLVPGYEQKNFNESQAKDAWKLLASPNGGDDSVLIHQDAQLFVTKLSKDKKLTYEIKANRRVWIQVARGKILLNNQPLDAGDGAGIVSEKSLDLFAQQNSEVLLFDLGV